MAKVRPGRLASMDTDTPPSPPRRKRIRLGWGRGAASPANSSVGVGLSSMTASSAVLATSLPVRRNHGTPDHRHESISSRSAAYVSTCESAATPGSSR